MPIIREKQINRKDVADLRDPLVGRDVDPLEALVQCVNCETTYFQTSYESLVQSNRERCLNCKADKFYRLVIIGGRSRSNRWESQGKASAGRGRKTKFVVALPEDIRPLPVPAEGERWQALLQRRDTDKLSKLQIGPPLGGEKTVSWSVPRIFQWVTEDTLVFGRSAGVFQLDVVGVRSRQLYKVPSFRRLAIVESFAGGSKAVHDFIATKDGHELIVVGERTRATLDVTSPRVHSWCQEYLADHVETSESAQRVSLSPSGDLWAHLTGKELSVFQTRFSSLVRTYQVGDVFGYFRGSHPRMRWSRSERFVGVSDRPYYPTSGSASSRTTILDLSTDKYAFGEVSRLLIDDQKDIACLAWHPELDICAVAFKDRGKTVTSGIALFDASTWEVLREKVLSPLDEVQCVDWSRDGRHVALGDNKGRIALWDLAEDETYALTGHENWVCGVYFSPDAQRLATSDLGGKTIIWSTNRPCRKLSQIDGLVGYDTEADYEIDVRFNGSPWNASGRRLALGTNRSIEVVELA